MASISLPNSQFSEDVTWDSLKRAIATSSGFQRWQSEKIIADARIAELGLEQLVRRYLRETLETLAY